MKSKRNWRPLRTQNEPGQEQFEGVTVFIKVGGSVQQLKAEINDVTQELPIKDPLSTMHGTQGFNHAR